MAVGETHTILAGDIEEKTEAMHVLESEFKDLESVHTAASEKLKQDIEAKNSLVQEHSRLKQNLTEVSQGIENGNAKSLGPLHHSKESYEERLAKVEDEIRAKEADIVADAMTLQNTELAEHQLNVCASIAYEGLIIMRLHTLLRS